ncbi:uncharacterized protein ColSpa_08430 [Colletotrichum spaethianum]|uniref:CorA-like Mg2+ transporter n=1 Tax=Colletotrichum spaethianum TaxID=700344 RepID=A0AA37P9R3_9PEZI|nr:uncharacterized protein ColSpa_08430 [Colletotrichum spaethianum]GKT48249.1 hypothetical protein ColSpa_08430 [Colletotrichum spaethianum]
MARFQGLDSSDLFRFDTLALRDDILLADGKSASKVEYDEYVVFKKDNGIPSGMKTELEGDQDISFQLQHKDEVPGYHTLDLAFRQGYSMDHNVSNISPIGPLTIETDSCERESSHRNQHDIRNWCWMDEFDECECTPASRSNFKADSCSICFRRNKSFDRREDGITMIPEDLDAMDLHPATLQYSRRVTNESRFWSLDRSKLSLILSFSKNPRTPYDFMSMTYDVRNRTSSVLVRQSYHPRQHSLENLDEYDQRLEACRAHWAHPFITPVVLLQVQFMRTEEAVMENINHVKALEWEVSSIAGFEAFEMERERRSKLMRRLTFGAQNEKVPQVAGPMSMANLMKRAHDVLKESIKLLDTVRWMERVVKLMLQAGDELAERMSTGELKFRLDDFHVRDTDADQRDRQEQQNLPDDPHTGPPSRSSASTRRRSLPPAPDPLADPLGNHWHEIRQYLEGLQRMCMGLETDRRMSEARCRAQIDIIYSKMAQEDNVLNARMAVASSRDSSSMKALAVITAIFLPGEFLGTLFGMSMFDWQASGEDAADDSAGAASNSDPGSSTNPKDPIPVLSHLFWVYWATVIPLTVAILVAWRAWWVSQDRYFRRHLSRELSEERYWTADGKPRELEHSFWWDFFYLSVRRDERPAPVNDPYSMLDLSPSMSQDKDEIRSPRGETTVRRGQISFLRSQSIRQRNAVAV